MYFLYKLLMSLTNIFQDSHLHGGPSCTYYFISVFIELPRASVEESGAVPLLGVKGLTGKAL